MEAFTLPPIAAEVFQLILKSLHTHFKPWPIYAEIYDYFLLFSLNMSLQAIRHKLSLSFSTNKSILHDKIQLLGALSCQSLLPILIKTFVLRKYCTLVQTTKYIPAMINFSLSQNFLCFLSQSIENGTARAIGSTFIMAENTNLQTLQHQPSL